MLLLIRVVMCRYRLVQIYWGPKCQRELIIHGNFLLYLPRPLRNSIKMYKKLERNTIYQFDIEILHKVMFTFLLAEKFKRSHFEFFAKMLSGETLCKLLQIFPPKVLIYIERIFLDTFLIILWKFTQPIKKYLKRIKNSNLKDWYCLLNLRIK